MVLTQKHARTNVLGAHDKVHREHHEERTTTGNFARPYVSRFASEVSFSKTMYSRCLLIQSVCLKCGCNLRISVLIFPGKIPITGNLHSDQFPTTFSQ